MTGGLARYRHYRTRDGRFVAVGALEDKFWENFCEVIGLPSELRNDRKTVEQSIRAVAEIMLGRDAAEWQQRFTGRDVCCTIVRTMQEAGASVGSQFSVSSGAQSMPGLPLPLAPAMRRPAGARQVPAIGEANAELGIGECPRAS